ncbi:hypothetical protein J3R83DRAFT_1361 [Lanmaoa asiatica]|nr:hypothetical protein J3R83DRAFT_1361 [Lanmaoa asiatica]
MSPNGFDSNTFGGVSEMPIPTAQLGTNIAATNAFLDALYVIGNVIGSLAAESCADQWERKSSMFIASAITFIRAICHASAEKRGGGDLIAGRIVLGVGQLVGIF